MKAALAAGFEAADKGLGTTTPGDTAWQAHALTAPNLAAKTFDPVPFVLPGFIAAGVTILAGKPRAGKSSLALDVALAVAGGCCAIGTLQPAHGAVLYLAMEESERRLQRRVERLLASVRAPSAERLVLVGRWRHLEEGGLGDLADWCSAVAEPRLIVIDTLAKVQPPEKARPYEIDRATVAGLRGLANARGVAVLAIHHTPKRNAEDVLDSMGLGNAADTMLVLARNSAGTVLHARGHDIEASETAVQLDQATGRWTLLGPAADVRRSHERGQILEILAAAGGEALPVRDIMAGAEMRNRNAADLMLGKMAAAGEIARAGRGRYALPKNGGQIGQKDRNESHLADGKTETGNLSDLSDLSGASEMRGTAGGG